VIQMQDLEHQPSALTRVNDKGVEVLPQINLTEEELELPVGLTPTL